MVDTIKSEIDKLLRERLILRTTAIIELLKPKNGEKPKGNSVPNIYRALTKLKNDGKIIRLEKDELEDYGIKEKDKNAVYYGLGTLKGNKEFYSTIFDMLSDSNKKKQITAMEEIVEVEGILLTSKILEKFEKIVKSASDERVLESSAKILRTHFQYGVYPKNIDEIASAFISKLDRNNVDKSFAKEVLWFLAIIENKKAIFWLEDFVSTSNHSLKDEWFEPSIWYKVMNKYKKELLEFSSVLPDDKRKWLKSLRIKSAEYEKEIQNKGGN